MRRMLDPLDEMPLGGIAAQQLHIRHKGIEDEPAAGQEMAEHGAEEARELVGRMQVEDRVGRHDDRVEPAIEIEVAHVELDELDRRSPFLRRGPCPVEHCSHERSPPVTVAPASAIGIVKRPLPQASSST